MFFCKVLTGIIQSIKTQNNLIRIMLSMEEFCLPCLGLLEIFSSIPSKLQSNSLRAADNLLMFSGFSWNFLQSRVDSFLFFQCVCNSINSFKMSLIGGRSLISKTFSRFLYSPFYWILVDMGQLQTSAAVPTRLWDSPGPAVKPKIYLGVRFCLYGWQWPTHRRPRVQQWLTDWPA